MGILYTARLELVPVTVEVVEAILAGQRERAEALLHARCPVSWPNRALIERAFYASLDAIRADPERRLWGDRVMITLESPRRIVGSVIFHGAPDEEGSVEVAYGVEEESQRRGYATEATRASVGWALEQPTVHVVRAATPPWHIASQKVLERCGLTRVGERESPLGEIWEYELRRPRRSP
ncbi:MAG: GNAT family N-acetyltransferase [Polyangiaceae bacterium]|nr:GNAT family N-acetyltransferase [Polyangiaceae bacterium]